LTGGRAGLDDAQIAMADPDLPAHSSLDDELTDGYAQALAIEAECLRTMRGITAAVDAGTGTSDEVKQLARKLRTLQAELKALRTHLEDRRRSIDPNGRLY
jgi:hypothetical protein